MQDRYRITATYTERVILHCYGDLTRAESRMDDMYSGILSENENEFLLFGKEKPFFKLEVLVDEENDVWAVVEPV